MTHPCSSNPDWFWDEWWWDFVVYATEIKEISFVTRQCDALSCMLQFVIKHTTAMCSLPVTQYPVTTWENRDIGVTVTSQQSHMCQVLTLKVISLEIQW